jgi:hypothetical protein
LLSSILFSRLDTDRIIIPTVPAALFLQSCDVLLQRNCSRAKLMAFTLPAGAAGGSTVASNVRSWEWVLAQHCRPDRCPCFRYATAYVRSRQSRPCIHTMMPEFMWLTIASPMSSDICCSLFVVIRMVGRLWSKRWWMLRLFAVSDDFRRLHACEEIHSSQGEINTPWVSQGFLSGIVAIYVCIYAPP